MVCSRCGRQLEEGSNFCNACGAQQTSWQGAGAAGPGVPPQGSGPYAGGPYAGGPYAGGPQYSAGAPYPGGPYAGAYAGPRGPITRPRYDRKIAGVCAALARHFDMDVTLVRVIAVILFLVWGTGFLAYVIGWVVIPEEPYALAPEYMPPPPAPPSAV